jgi:hypothetical protein
VLGVRSGQSSVSRCIVLVRDLLHYGTEYKIIRVGIRGHAQCEHDDSDKANRVLLHEVSLRKSDCSGLKTIWVDRI